MSGLGCKLLKKMGWTEGTGIGKCSTGIVEPIKPRLKTGTSGMGYKESEQLCSGWWMDAFNKAASSTSVPAESDSGRAAEGSRKRRKHQHLETPLPVLGRPYSAFGSSAILHEGREVSSPTASSKSPTPLSSSSATSLTVPPTPTDEELLAACGGRTGHAAARFGLSLGGKLARVRAQELGVSTGAAPAPDPHGKPERRDERKRRRQQQQKRTEPDQSESPTTSYSSS